MSEGMTDEDRVGHLWRALNACKELNADLTIATVTHWLEHHGAGYPDVAMSQERVRDDAKFWSISASQAELQAYLAASLVELERSPLTVRAAKRLAALGVNNLDAVALDGFKEWLRKRNAKDE